MPVQESTIKAAIHAWECEDRIELDVDVRRALALHIDTPPGLLEVLATDADEIVVEHVAWNPAVPPSAALLLLDHPEYGLAQSSNLGLHTPSRALGVRLPQNPSCPPEALARLLALPRDWNLDTYLAENPNSPPHLLETLASHWVRALPELSDCGDEGLGRRTGMYVLRAVAGNSNTPKAALNSLADQVPDLAPALASNRNASAQLLVRLAAPLWKAHRFSRNEAATFAIAESLASNPSSPSYLLELLAFQDASVACRILGRCFDVAGHLGKNSSASETVLAIVARSPAGREQILRNSKVSELALMVCRDQDPGEAETALRTLEVRSDLYFFSPSTREVLHRQFLPWPWEIGPRILYRVWIITAVGAVGWCLLAALSRRSWILGGIGFAPIVILHARQTLFGSGEHDGRTVILLRAAIGLAALTSAIAASGSCSDSIDRWAGLVLRDAAAGHQIGPMIGTGTAAVFAVLAIGLMAYSHGRWSPRRSSNALSKTLVTTLVLASALVSGHLGNGGLGLLFGIMTFVYALDPDF